jgi:hypothetical protein
LPEHLRERLRACDLSYELVEASEPRVVRGPPPLVPRKPVLRVVAG